MPWQATGCVENGVKANPVVGVARICGEKMFGGLCDAGLLARVDGGPGFGKAGAGFHLDGQQQPPAAGHQIDLADRRTVARGENTKPFQAQQDGGMAFGTMATLFGRAAPRGAGPGRGRLRQRSSSPADKDRARL